MYVCLFGDYVASFNVIITNIIFNYGLKSFPFPLNFSLSSGLSGY